MDGKIKCIDEELPFDIPQSWSWCRLNSIGDWQSGATPSRKVPEYYDGKIPWIKTGDLNDSYIYDIPETINENALKETSVKLIPADTVLIAMYGATIGKVGITTCEATTNQACCACCNLSGVLSKYLFYFLQSHKCTFEKMAVGGAQSNISKEKIISTLFPLPPKTEQVRIVSIVDRIKGILQVIEGNLN